MTQTSSPSSSPTPLEDRTTQATRPARLRSVFFVSLIASIVALLLAGAGVVGLWEHVRPGLNEAREVGAFVRQSAARDLSRVIDLLHNDEEEAALVEDKDEPARGRTQLTRTTDPTTERNSDGTGPKSPALVTGPTLTTDSVRLAGAAVSVEPPMHLVFDGRDVGVTPPLMQRVRLRSVLRPGLFLPGSTGETGLVEVVVSVSGTVESAKFVTRPLNVHESMLLSAVKAWRFRPATRNGQAIRYRLRVPISRVRV